jgi:hypothetical protein
VAPDGENATSLGSVGSFRLDVTVSLAVEITLIPPSEGWPVCGPVSATHTWLPSGVTARSSGS